MSSRDLKLSYWPAEPGEVRETTVCDLLHFAAKTVPERLALVDFAEDEAARKEWTYRQFVSDVERMCRALLSKFERGDRIAIWAPNSAEWIVLQQAIALAGMVLVALNPAYQSREVQFVLNQSGARGLFYVDEYRGLNLHEIVNDIRPEAPDLRDVFPFSTWNEVIASGDPTRDLPIIEPSDMIQIQYTSGTTGFPKGAMLHHMGLINEATFVAERAGMYDGGVYINAMPMYHIGGGAVTSFGAWAKRGTFVILPRFEPSLVLEAFETYRGTHTLLVPTMVTAILDHPDLARRDLSSLTTILSGAASVPASLVRRTTELLGCQFSILFGQTEAHGVISQTRVTDSPDDQADTVGQPLPQLEVKIAEVLTGKTVPLNEQGEICCRGYQTMRGYFGMPDETSATIDEEGWLHMGDLGTMDARGFLRITGRIKDMIIRGGMNLYPAEIEMILEEHPAVLSAVVIGVPDEKWGEQVAAVVRLREGLSETSIDDLHDFMSHKIARHKIPIFWVFVEEYPMTPTGKIQRFVLRNQVSEGALDLQTRVAFS